MFCKKTGALLIESTTQDKLQFKSPKTGIPPYEAKPDDTLLAQESSGEIHSVSKYKNTLHTMAFDRTVPRHRLPDGCSECGRRVVSYQRLGEEKSIFYACICGAAWNN